MVSERDDVRVTRIEWVRLEGTRPRAAGANARIGWLHPGNDVALQSAFELSSAVAIRDSFACCVDGHNLWFHDFVNQGGSDPTYFARLDSLPLGNIIAQPSMGEPPGAQQFIKPYQIGINGKAACGHMTFDGDSIFVLVDDGSGNISWIRRIPRAGSRN